MRCIMKKSSFCFLSVLLVFTLISPLFSQNLDNSAKEETPVIAQNVETQKDTLNQKEFEAQEKMPEVVSMINPVYPEEAKKKNLEGKVWLKIFIDEKGNPGTIEVTKSTHAIFEQPAIEAARKYKFTPALKVGKPIGVYVVLPFQFKLDKQKKIDKAEEECYYKSADEMPSILGGMSALFKKLTYPEQAKKKNVEGKVLIKIYVDENGNIDATNVIKGIGYGCDEAAEKAARSCKFTPAKHAGKNVKAQVVLPVQFKLK